MTLTVCALIASPVYFDVLAAERAPEYEDIFDFGSVSIESDEIRSTFVISNHGNDTLKIKNAHCSSDFIQILSYPQEIPLHENGNLQIRLIPAELGEIKCEILLETENLPNPVLRYALKGIIEGENSGEEKNRMCPEIPPELITRRLMKRNPAFAISAESVLRKLNKKEKIILIDARNREEFKKFRIPGSINIPLFAIKTKVFLKSKPLILVNEGYNYARLEQECKRLKKSGFTEVWVLNGGLNVWKQKGDPLHGDIFAQRELNKISSQIFFEEKNDEDCLVIDVSGTKNSEAQYLIPQTVAIPLADNSQEFVSKIRRTTDELKKNPFSSVLIFNQSGKQYEKVEKLIRKTALKNVFYLKDGLNGYTTFLQRQALIWQPNNHSKKMLKKCANCP